MTQMETQEEIEDSVDQAIDNELELLPARRAAKPPGQLGDFFFARPPAEAAFLSSAYFAAPSAYGP
jgi:hypothetical protein